MSGLNTANLEKIVSQQSTSKLNPVSYDKDELYDYAGEKLGLISRYPSYSPFRDNENFFAQQQSGLDKSLNALKSFSTLAGNTFLNHFASYGRQVAAMTNGDWSKLWDDEFGETAANKIKAQFNLNPIYETSAQQNRRDTSSGLGGALAQFVPFTGRAGNAWANLMGQLGFTVGTIGAVAAENVALGLAIPETGGASGAAIVAKSGMNANKVKNALYTLLKTPKALFNVKGAANASKIGKVVNSTPFQTYRMFVAASGEAAIEANMAALEFKEKQVDKYVDEYGEEPTPEFMTELDKRAVEMGNTVFNWNIPVLMTSNALVIGNMFRPANPALSKVVQKEVLKKAGIQPMKGVVSSVLNKSKVFRKIADSPFSKAGKALTFATKENLSEGFEEVAQGIGSRAAQHQFDMFNSETGRGMGAFMTSMGDEFKHTFSAQGEGWDEFVSGLLTGYGIKIGKTVADKVTGASANRQAYIDSMSSKIKNSIETLTDPSQNHFRELIANTIVADNMQNAINNNDIKGARDYKLDALGEMMMNLEGTGLGDSVYDHMGEVMKEFQETDSHGFNEMMGETSIEDVVLKLKAQQKQYDKDINQLKKNIGNPYSSKTEPRLHNAWNKSIQIAGLLNINAQDAFNRYKGIQDKLIKENPAAEILIESMLDPAVLTENTLKLRQLRDDQKKSLTTEGLSASEKAIRNAQLSETEKQLKVLEDIEKSTKKDKNKQAEDRASLLLAGFFGDEKRAPQGLKQDLVDMQNLESEHRDFLTAYNLLSNPEYFNSYGEAFVNGYRRGTDNLIKEGKENLRKDLTDSQKVVQSKISESEYETLVNDITNIGDIIGVPKSVSIKNGNLVYKGKTYDTVNDLINELEANFSNQLDVKVGDKTMRDVLKERLNGLLDETAEEIAEEKVRDTVVAQPTPNNFRKSTKMKTKKDSENKSFGWNNVSLKATILHYFDSVLGKIWKGDGIASIRAKLEANNQFEDSSKLGQLASELGGNANLTMLYLADEGTLSNYKENDNIRIHHDGIRYYILTAQGQSPTAVIKDATGLTIENTPNVAVVLDEQGNPIQSPFRDNLFNAKTDEEIHSMRIGDAVELVIANNDYNKNLQALFDNGEITEEQYYDRLVVHAISNDNVVGVLRAGDFLFERPDVKEELQKFRGKFVDKNLGDSIGIHNVKATSTTRNYRVEGGKTLYTPVNEWTAGTYTKEYFYVRETAEGNLQVVDQNGNEVDSSRIDIRDLEPNTVLMKIEDTKGRNHTVTLFREDADNRRVTEKEFFDRWDKLSDVLSTNLSLSEPIASKRLIIDLTNESESLDNLVDEVEDQIEEVADDFVESSPIALPESTRANLEVLSEIDRQAIEKKYGISISVNKDTGRLRIQLLSNELSADDIQALQQDISNAKNRAVIVESVKEAEVINGLTPIEGYTFSVEDGEQVITAPDGTKLIKSVDGSVTMEGDFDVNNLIQTFPEVFGGLNKPVVQVRDANNNPKVLTAETATTMAESLIGAEKVDKSAEGFDIFQYVIDSLNSITEGKGVNFVGKLIDFLQIQRKEGTSINTLQELMELAQEQGVLTSEEIEAFNFVVTPLFRGDFWMQLQGAENVWDSSANAEWQSFTNSLRPIVEDLESANLENSPVVARNKFLKNIEARLRKVFGAFGMNISDLTFYSLSSLNKLRNTLREMVESVDIKSKFNSFNNKLSEIGSSLYTKGLLNVLKVNRQSILRQPLTNKDDGGVFTDLEMSNVDGKTYVRNESDGLFIEVKKINKKASKDIRKLQNDFVSLLGVKPTVEYLQAYEKINGSILSLQNRLSAELTKGRDPNSYGAVEIKDIHVLDKGTNYITSKVNETMVELNGNVYQNLKTFKGESLYVKNGSNLSSKQIENIFKNAGFKNKFIKKQSKLTSRVEKLKSVERKIEELTCS